LFPRTVENRVGRRRSLRSREGSVESIVPSLPEPLRLVVSAVRTVCLVRVLVAHLALRVLLVAPFESRSDVPNPVPELVDAVEKCLTELFGDPVPVVPVVPVVLDVTPLVAAVHRVGPLVGRVGVVVSSGAVVGLAVQFAERLELFSGRAIVRLVVSPREDEQFPERDGRVRVALCERVRERLRWVVLRDVRRTDRVEQLRE
jgi:hypothetical protein